MFSPRISLDSVQVMVFQLIQSLLPPSRLTKKVLAEKKEKKKFYTVNESREAFVMICKTEADYKQMFDRKVEIEVSVPPYISLIGSVEQPQYFMVDFENITYKCFKFAKALEICVKTYFVFNIAFPEACDSIWEFVNEQFFRVEPQGKKAKPGIDALLHDIRCKYQNFLFTCKIIL